MCASMTLHIPNAFLFWLGRILCSSVLSTAFAASFRFLSLLYFSVPLAFLCLKSRQVEVGVLVSWYKWPLTVPYSTTSNVDESRRVHCTTVLSHLLFACSSAGSLAESNPTQVGSRMCVVDIVQALRLVSLDRQFSSAMLRSPSTIVARDLFA